MFLMVAQYDDLRGKLYRSGQSIFARPKPIDLSAARRAGLSLDMNLDLSDDESDGLLHRNAVVFDAQDDQHERQHGAMSDMPRAAQAVRERDEEDMWAELG
jgi:hypothetical protein